MARPRSASSTEPSPSAPELADTEMAMPAAKVAHVGWDSFIHDQIKRGPVTIMGATDVMSIQDHNGLITIKVRSATGS